MWEFMVKYAKDFWEAGEYSFEVFTVLLAWGITLAMVSFAIGIIYTIGMTVIHEIKKGRKENG